MKKTPFVTKQQVEEIVKQFPTPFHLYDEAGIRANAQAVKDAFAWNPGFREYFAVKATPNPYLLKILKDYDMGCDCSSYTELMLAKSCGFDGEHIMFSSNDTPAEEFAYADKLGAKFNVVIGDNEVENKIAKLKNMQTGEETEINLDTFVSGFYNISLNDQLADLEINGEEFDFGSLFGLKNSEEE